MNDYLADALDLIEHHVMPPEERAHLLLLADIAQSLRPKASTEKSAAAKTEAVWHTDGTGWRDDGTGWPARKGWSAIGNTWLCPEPGCGFGISGLLADLAFDDLDPIGEHIREHVAQRVESEKYPALASLSATPAAAPTWECPACGFRGPQALTEPSLVALDRFDELAGEVRRWREADRIFPPEAQEWWDATNRFRDVADRFGGAL